MLFTAGHLLYCFFLKINKCLLPLQTVLITQRTKTISFCTNRKTHWAPISRWWAPELVWISAPTSFLGDSSLPLLETLLDEWRAWGHICASLYCEYLSLPASNTCMLIIRYQSCSLGESEYTWTVCVVSLFQLQTAADFNRGLVVNVRMFRCECVCVCA